MASSETLTYPSGTAHRYVGIKSLEPVGVFLPGESTMRNPHTLLMMLCCYPQKISRFWGLLPFCFLMDVIVCVASPGEKNYPGGGPFDPLEFSKDAPEFVDQVGLMPHPP